MSYNVIIPCSGPGSRSSSYSKFHKALIRIGKKAVINHIIDSYKDAKTVFIMLGYNGDYIKEYLTHCGYKNIQYIDIPNWQESQFESLRQLPVDVFDESFYLNSCDNWTTTIPEATDNTAFLCNPVNTDYYDKANGHVFAGIGYVKDGNDFYNTLHSTTETRNDYLIYKSLNRLNHSFLDDWYDVGNVDSLTVTQQHYVEQFDLLDKTSQEIYYVGDKVIKLFNSSTENLKKILTTNLAFPHPTNLQFSNHSVSYDFVNGKTNVDNEDFLKLFKNLSSLWNFCIVNNKTNISNDIWQHKTVERFEQFIKKYPEFSKPVKVNGVIIDPVRVIEQLDWKLLNHGITGPCHGDLNLDNIILDTDNIYYIDHRASVVQDIFYDVCKLYHSLYLDNKTLKHFRLKIHESAYEISIDQNNPVRRDIFINSELYNNYRKKIELGVGCIWLSMSPLNVNDSLNKFLFLYAISHLQKVSKF